MYMASPSYQDGVLYAGDIDGKLRAFEADSGKELWEFDAEMEIDAGPNFYKESLLLTSQNGTLYCLSKQGELNWKYSIEQPLQCGATLAGDMTFLGGCDEQFHMIDVKKGTAVGKPLPLGAPTGSTPSVFENRVFVPTYAGAIFAFEPGKPEPLWMFRDPKLADKFENTSVAVAKGVIVATSRTPKRIFALDAKTGKVKWEVVPRKRSDASPIIAGGSAFVAAADGRILRLDLMTGKQLWMSEVKPGFLGAPAAADGCLVVANDRGTVFCFGKKK
jgi:outer membrane protein assembly factor BamB